MATTTPNYGWTVPTSTDLVKDGATAIETLGDAIDASLVDLRGGTTGQVLKKASATQMDFEWGSAGGLTLINTTSFSGVASQSVNDVFSATYENYRIVLTGIVASGGEQNLSFRVRVSGTDLTTSTYIYSEQSLGANGSSYNNTSTSATSIVLGRIGQTGYSSIFFDVAQPFLANRTTTNSASASDGTTTFFKGNGAGLVANTTSYTGFTFFPTGSTITGTVSVYGYNK